MNITNSNTLIIVDEGHGRDTLGKRSPLWSDGTQLYEWEFNRFVGKQFMNHLRLGNISFVRLVSEDTDISLTERKRRADDYYNRFKKNYYVYCVSIHGNAAEDGRANGIEVFTSHGKDDSDAIAQIYLEKLSELGWKMRYDKSDGDLDKEANFAILKLSCPSILTENGFYSNEQECKKMLSLQWRNRIAYAHYLAAKSIELNVELNNRMI